MLKPYFTCPQCGGKKTFQGKLCRTCRFGTKHQQIWSRIDKRGPDECWPWIGKTYDDEGRGRISGGQLATRAIYEEIHGPLPKGIQVCHTCDNPPCCNPDHFFPGTNSDNQRDCHKKGRANRKGERNNFAKLNAEDVLLIRKEAQRDSLAEIARRRSVDITTIWKIVHRVSWKHVA